MASPESSNKLVGGLNICIMPPDGHQVSPSSSSSSSSSKTGHYIHTHHSLDFNTDDSSSSKSKLPVVLEESESFSHTDSSSTFASSSSSLSSSSTSSSHPFFRRRRRRRRRHNAQRMPIKTAPKKMSFLSLLLWPLKKVRDGYMNCMMNLDGAGDLSVMVQGASFATSAKHFADLPLSKTDSRSYG